MSPVSFDGRSPDVASVFARFESSSVIKSFGAPIAFPKFSRPLLFSAGPLLAASCSCSTVAIDPDPPLGSLVRQLIQIGLLRLLTPADLHCSATIDTPSVPWLATADGSAPTCSTSTVVPLIAIFTGQNQNSGWNCCPATVYAPGAACVSVNEHIPFVPHVGGILASPFAGSAHPMNSTGPYPSVELRGTTK